jgi:type I restriction enzyme R subunit
MDKCQLSERDICTKFITPAIQQAGWQQHQFREEVSLHRWPRHGARQAAARIKNPEAKGGPKRADFVLYARPMSRSPWSKPNRRSFLLATVCSRLWPMPRC